MAGRGLRKCLYDITGYLIFLVFISTLGSLQFGYHLAELNAPEEVITCRKKSIFGLGGIVKAALSRYGSAGSKRLAGSFLGSGLPACLKMNEAAFATVSSVFTVGGLIGALVAGPVSSRHGRLFAMRITALIYILGATTETFAPSVVVITIGRLISGTGSGAATVIVPLYISEIAPPDEKGLFGVMTQISICSGILLTQTLGYFLSHDKAWRWILAAGIGIAVVQGLGLLGMPESPAWLASHRSVASGRAVLQRIRGRGFDIRDEVKAWGGPSEGSDEEESLLIGSQHQTIPAEPAAQHGIEHSSFLQVALDPVHRPAIIAVVGLMFAQQFCGINSIIMYSVSLLADLLPISSSLLTILISIVNLITTVACSPLPDRLGRKACLLTSILGQCVSSFALALSIVFGAKILSAISVLVYVAFFAVGLGSIPFLLASELVGQEAVGATQSWCLSANYIASFLVAQFFPIINKALNKALGGHGGWVYFLFAGLSALSALFVQRFVPETKGKKDVDEVWGRPRRLD